MINAASAASSALDDTDVTQISQLRSAVCSAWADSTTRSSTPMSPMATTSRLGGTASGRELRPRARGGALVALATPAEAWHRRGQPLTPLVPRHRRHLVGKAGGRKYRHEVYRTE